MLCLSDASTIQFLREVTNCYRTFICVMAVKAGWWSCPALSILGEGTPNRQIVRLGTPIVGLS